MQVISVLFCSGFRQLSRYVEASFATIFSSIILLIVQFFLWKAINSDFTSMQALATYLVFSHVIACFYPSGLSGRLGGLIRKGDIAFALLRPYPLPLLLCYEELGASAYFLCFTALPVFIAGLFVSSFSIAVHNVFLALAFAFLSYIIACLTELLFACLQFITNSSWGVNSLKYAVIMLLSGRILPLAFYPSWAKSIVNALPFRFIYAVPLEVLSGSTADTFLNLFAFALMWIAVLFSLFFLVYSSCIRRVIISGG